MNIKGLHPSLIKFREDNLKFETSLERFRDSFSNARAIHNGTYENLFLYHRLQEFIEKDKVVFYMDGVWLLNNLKHKFFINDNPHFIEAFDWTSVSPDVYKKIVIYTTVQQENFSLSGAVESKQKEVTYDLKEVFEYDTWAKWFSDLPNKKAKKKFYNRVVAPFKLLDSRFEVKDIEVDDMPVIEQIHKEWVDVKLADERTFKMMFSSNRYNRTISMMFDSPYVSRDKFYAKLFFWEGKPVAVRQILVDNGHGYDIGFFSRFWEVPSQLINCINIWCMKDMMENNITTLNAGLAASTGMKVNKHHFPHTQLTSFKYNLRA